MLMDTTKARRMLGWTAAWRIAGRLCEARQSGIACIAAAGSNAGPVGFPALLPTVLAVAAIGKLGTFPPDSDHVTQFTGAATPEGYFPARSSADGPEIDLCAPVSGWFRRCHPITSAPSTARRSPRCTSPLWLPWSWPITRTFAACSSREAPLGLTSSSTSCKRAASPCCSSNRRGWAEASLPRPPLSASSRAGCVHHGHTLSGLRR
jgi:hypothetical protein